MNNLFMITIIAFALFTIITLSIVNQRRQRGMGLALALTWLLTMSSPGSAREAQKTVRASFAGAIICAVYIVFWLANQFTHWF